MSNTAIHSILKSQIVCQKFFFEELMVLIKFVDNKLVKNVKSDSWRPQHRMPHIAKEISKTLNYF